MKRELEPVSRRTGWLIATLVSIAIWWLVLSGCAVI